MKNKNPAIKLQYGELESAVAQHISSLRQSDIQRRIFQKDASIWSKQKQEQDAIKNRLGWLNLPSIFSKQLKASLDFTEKIKAEGYKYAVLLGMGGSSLCTEVSKEVFGNRRGFLKIFVLDNTSPEAILQLKAQIDLDKTLFIVASKSGTTTEPNCFFEYFYRELNDAKIKNPGSHFVAITDADTPLVKIAHENKFRTVFVNPGDIGGRYSVLSYFGILPMTLMGIDVHELMERAKQMEEHCAKWPESIEPGTLIGIAQQHGRDKITFVFSDEIKSFGFWVEQLIAESTGKDGKGLIPVHGEKLLAPEQYNNDRIFVSTFINKEQPTITRKLELLAETGHPVIKIQLGSIMDLGAEYYRWEFNTAVAGIVMQINPFNEPNVAESKKNTVNVLEEWIKNKKYDAHTTAVAEEKNITLYVSKAVSTNLKLQDHSLPNFLNAFTEMTTENDYIALLPYFLETDKRDRALQNFRHKLQLATKAATTLLYGPRYLHSTGQLHKGGPNTGLYILFTADSEQLAIPGEKFDFGMLQMAQALGDFISLDSKNRRVLRVHLGKHIDKNLAYFCSLLNKTESNKILA